MPQHNASESTEQRSGASGSQWRDNSSTSIVLRSHKSQARIPCHSLANWTLPHRDDVKMIEKETKATSYEKMKTPPQDSSKMLCHDPLAPPLLPNADAPVAGALLVDPAADTPLPTETPLTPLHVPRSGKRSSMDIRMRPPDASIDRRFSHRSIRDTSIDRRTSLRW